MNTQSRLSIWIVGLLLSLLGSITPSSNCWAAPARPIDTVRELATPTVVNINVASPSADLDFAETLQLPQERTNSVQFDREADQPLPAANLVEWLARIELIAKHLLPTYHISTLPECTTWTAQKTQRRFEDRFSSVSGPVELYLYNTNRSTQAPSIQALSIVVRSDQEIVALSRRSAGLENAAEIVLSLGLLEQIQTTAELAFVLSHELAHVELNHFSFELPLGIFTQQQLARIAEVHIDWELRADNRALELMTSAGYQTQQAAAILSRIQGKTLRHDPVELRSHPTLAARLEALQRVSRFLQTARLESSVLEAPVLSARYLDAPSK